MSGKIIIGVTGEIGAGKTTFVKELGRYNVYPIYADEIAHEVLKQRNVQTQLKSYFGKKVFVNGKISLKNLASEAFKDKQSWQKLIFTTHPYILKKIFQIIEDSNHKFFAIDAPLLFESGLDEHCNYIVFIETSKSCRKKRLKKLSWKEAEKRNSYLLPSKTKKKLVDFVVDNNQNKRRLKENAKKIWFRVKNY